MSNPSFDSPLINVFPSSDFHLPLQEEIEGLSPIASGPYENHFDEGGSEPSQDSINMVESVLEPVLSKPPVETIVYPSASMFELLNGRFEESGFTIDLPTVRGFPSKEFLSAVLQQIESGLSWPIEVYTFPGFLRLGIKLRDYGSYIAELIYKDPKNPALFECSPFAFYVKEFKLEGEIFLSVSEISRLDPAAARAFYKYLAGPPLQELEAMDEETVRSKLVELMKARTGEKEEWPSKEFIITAEDYSIGVVASHALGENYALADMPETVEVIGYCSGTNATGGTEHRAQIRLDYQRGEKQNLYKLVGLLTRFANSAVVKYGSNYAMINVIESQCFFTPVAKRPMIDSLKPAAPKQALRPVPPSPAMAMLTTKKSRTTRKMSPPRSVPAARLAAFRTQERPEGTGFRQFRNASPPPTPFKPTVATEATAHTLVGPRGGKSFQKGGTQEVTNNRRTSDEKKVAADAKVVDATEATMNTAGETKVADKPFELTLAIIEEVVDRALVSPKFTNKLAEELADKFAHKLVEMLTDTPVDTQTIKLADTLADTITGKIADRVADKLTDTLSNKLTAALTDKLTTALTDKLTAALTDKLTTALTDKLSDMLVNKLTGALTDKMPNSEAPKF